MLDILLRASVEGAVLVALVWMAVRALPGLSPSARAALWWCAAAKFVVALVWVAPIEIAVLPPPSRPVLEAGATPMADLGTAAASDDPRPAMRLHEAGAEPAFSLSDALLAAWCAGLAATLGSLARRWRRAAGIIRRASPAPPHVQAATRDLAGWLALARTPHARVSGEVDTPLVAGLRRPTLLLPNRFTRLSALQQQMAICHELTHVKRGDLWLGCIPALAERLFFFHPLVHLASREYVFWRESACDAAVIETLRAAPCEYGRLLLDLGIASPRPNLAAAGASWSVSNLKRRIHMLGDVPRASRSGTSRFLAAAAVLLALCAAAPWRLVAREPMPSHASDAPGSAAGEPSQAAGREPQRPAAPAPPAAPARPAEPRQRAERDDRLEPNYVLFLAGGGDERVHMSGSRQDVERARTLRRGDESLLWFRDQRGEFVVRDPSVLRQVEAIWTPVAQLGEKQGRLGAEQGALGSKMGELGAQQGLIGTEQGRIGARQSAIGAEQAAIGARQAAIGAQQAELAAKAWNASEAQRTEIDKAQRELDQQMRALDGNMKALNAPMRALDEEMKALDAKIHEFDKPMRGLSAKMEALGAEMTKLGQQMEEASARARTELRELLDRAIASGAAQAVK